eukprot:202579_1
MDFDIFSFPPILLNGDAKEFVPSFMAGTEPETSSKNPSSGDTMDDGNNTLVATQTPIFNPMHYQNAPSYNQSPVLFYPPQTIQCNTNTNYIPNTMIQSQLHQQAHQHIQQLQMQQQLFDLFPSIPPPKLQQIFKSCLFDLKRSILFIIQSKEFKGQYDKNVCVYHLSNKCQYENNQ